MEEERSRDIDMKRKRMEDKESHSLEVRKQMEAREFNRIGSIKEKQSVRESVMAKT